MKRAHPTLLGQLIYESADGYKFYQSKWYIGNLYLHENPIYMVKDGYIIRTAKKGLSSRIFKNTNYQNFLTEKQITINGKGIVVDIQALAATPLFTTAIQNWILSV